MVHQQFAARRVACYLRRLNQRKNNNPMKQLQASLLLTAALSFVAASVFAQAAKSPPAAGASASPSTPPTFAFGHKSVATLKSANLVEPITSRSGRQTTRLFQATFAAAHCFDHYGQMIEYLRMNGIVPPASRGQ